jgi:hypothetical protein
VGNDAMMRATKPTAAATPPTTTAVILRPVMMITSRDPGHGMLRPGDKPLLHPTVSQKADEAATGYPPDETTIGYATPPISAPMGGLQSMTL